MKVKIKIVSFLVCFVAITLTVRAQWVTSDPLHTGVTTLIKLFQDPSFKTIVKNIEKLQKVSTAVQQIKQGKEIIGSISRSVQTISSLATAASKDGHIYPIEFTYMTSDLDKIAKLGTEILADMKTGLAGSGNVLKMEDAERATWIREVHKRVMAYESGIQIYFNNIQKRSFSRTTNNADIRNTSALYKMVGDAAQSAAFTYNANITGSGYDASYDNTDKSILDDDSPALKAKDAEKKLRNHCQLAYENYYDMLQIEEAKNEGRAFATLLRQGYMWESKETNFWQNTFTPGAQFKKEAETFEATLSGGSTEVSFSDAYKGFIAPNGKKISNTEMETLIRIESRKSIPDIRAELKERFDLSKCDGLN
jgi:hypothetical protein